MHSNNRTIVNKKEIFHKSFILKLYKSYLLFLFLQIFIKDFHYNSKQVIFKLAKYQTFHLKVIHFFKINAILNKANELCA